RDQPVRGSTGWRGRIMADPTIDPNATVTGAPPADTATTPATAATPPQNTPQPPSTSSRPAATAVAPRTGGGMAGTVAAIRQGYADQASHLDDQAKAMIAQIGKQGDQLGEAMKRVRDAQDKADEAQTAATKALAAPPKHPEQDSLKKMGGLATVVGILGGLFTRAPMTASLNAAASAIEAYNKGDEKNYELAYKQWQTQTDMMFKVAEMQSNRVKEIMSNEEMGLNERKTMLDLTLRTAGLSQLADAARINGESVVLDWQEKMQSAAQQFKIHEDTVKMHHEDRLDALRAREDAKWTLMTGVGDDGKPQQFWVNPSERKIEDMNRQPVNYTPTNLTKAASGAAISDDAADFIADGLLAGNRQAATGLARNAANMAKVDEALTRKAKEKGVSGADLAAIQAEFQGNTAGERAVGTRTANMEIAANEVKNMAPLALMASEKVDRTQYPTLNSVILAAEKGSGDEDVVRFGLAANSLIYMYAKFLNPNGIPTDADKAKAADILSTAWAKGQFRSAVDQIQQEIKVGK